MTYLVYENYELLAGFMSLCVAEVFSETWRGDSSIPMDIVDSNTGEIINTFVHGSWEKKN